MTSPRRICHWQQAPVTDAPLPTLFVSRSAPQKAKSGAFRPTASPAIQPDRLTLIRLHVGASILPFSSARQPRSGKRRRHTALAAMK